MSERESTIVKLPMLVIKIICLTGVFIVKNVQNVRKLFKNMYNLYEKYLLWRILFLLLLKRRIIKL